MLMQMLIYQQIGLEEDITSYGYWLLPPNFRCLQFYSVHHVGCRQYFDSKPLKMGNAAAVHCWDEND